MIYSQFRYMGMHFSIAYLPVFRRRTMKKMTGEFLFCLVFQAYIYIAIEAGNWAINTLFINSDSVFAAFPCFRKGSVVLKGVGRLHDLSAEYEVAVKL